MKGKKIYFFSMQFLCIIFSTVYILAPPPVRTTFGGGDDDEWSFSLLDMYEGSRILRDFSMSYDEYNEQCDFSCNPYLKTPTPQGLVGFYKYDEVKAVLHVLDYGQHLKVTSIATPARDFEVAENLLEQINNVENLEIDNVALRNNQPRWGLILSYYE